MKTRFYVLTGVGLCVLSFAGGIGLLLHSQQQQYARNRQLIAALDHDDFPKALALVNAGADPNTRETLPPPSIRPPSIKLLLNQLLHTSPPVVPSDDPGQTAFTRACMGWGHSAALLDDDNGARRRVALVQAMLAHGANVNTRATAEETTLKYAAYENRRRIVELLLAHGANIDTQDDLGSTPLMDAAGHACPDMMNFLLAHGATVNMQDKEGNTALHKALWGYPSDEIIRPLLRHGADPYRRNKRGETPLALAQEPKDQNPIDYDSQNPRTIALLRNRGK